MERHEYDDVEYLKQHILSYDDFYKVAKIRESLSYQRKPLSDIFIVFPKQCQNNKSMKESDRFTIVCLNKNGMLMSVDIMFPNGQNGLNDVLQQIMKCGEIVFKRKTLFDMLKNYNIDGIVLKKLRYPDPTNECTICRYRWGINNFWDICYHPEMIEYSLRKCVGKKFGEISNKIPKESSQVPTELFDLTGGFSVKRNDMIVTCEHNDVVIKGDYLCVIVDNVYHHKCFQYITYAKMVDIIIRTFNKFGIDITKIDTFVDTEQVCHNDYIKSMRITISTKLSVQFDVYVEKVKTTTSDETNKTVIECDNEEELSKIIEMSSI